MSVLTDILYPSLRLAGVVTAAGRGPSVSQRSDAFQALNRMLDAWNAQRLMISSVQSARYPMVPSQTNYTIGPGADFDTDAPLKVMQANVVLASSPENHVALRLLTAEEWAAKNIREMPTTIPTEMYIDGAHPVSTIYLWGYPTGGNDLELFTWSPVTQFAAQDDAVTMAPAYLEAVVYNLAMRLSGQFGTMPHPTVMQIARESKGIVKASNAASPRIASADIGTQCDCSGGWNYMTGQ